MRFAHGECRISARAFVASALLDSVGGPNASNDLTSSPPIANSSLYRRKRLQSATCPRRPAFPARFLSLRNFDCIWLKEHLLPCPAVPLLICNMGRKGLLGWALHLFSIASSLVSKPLQSLQEITTNTSSALDASSNSYAIQIRIEGRVNILGSYFRPIAGKRSQSQQNCP